MKEVTILIPTRFNNRWILDLNLRTIRKYTRYPYRIIVGDASMEQEAADFLATQKDVRVVQCPDPIRPKDYLARVAETPYFLFLHDDVQILKSGWLETRVGLLEKDSYNGIVGPVSTNYARGWGIFKRLYKFYGTKRFLPLGMLVRKETQEELDLSWGIIVNAFDTGGTAYIQFSHQKKWKFVPYKFNQDMLHWAQMTWVMKKRKKTTLNVEDLQKEREEKIQRIKEIIRQEKY